MDHTQAGIRVTARAHKRWLQGGRDLADIFLPHVLCRTAPIWVSGGDPNGQLMRGNRSVNQIVRRITYALLALLPWTVPSAELGETVKQIEAVRLESISASI